jgi:hypothetical protein
MQLPPISTDRSDHFNYTHKKNIMDNFIDMTPPRDVAQIYTSSKVKLKDLQLSLDTLEFKYNFKNAQLCSNPYSFNDFYQRYARPLSHLRNVAGMDALNNSDKIKHLIKIINNNLKNMRRKNRRKRKWKKVANVMGVAAEASTAFTHGRPVSDVSGVGAGGEGSDDEPDEQPKDVINLQLYYQQTDPVIAPLIQELKEEALRVTGETFANLQILGELFDKSLDAVDNYMKIIVELDRINAVYDRYFKSFYNRNQVSQFLLKFYDSKRASVERGESGGGSANELSNEDYECKLLNLLDTPIKYDEQRDYFARKIKSMVKRLKKILNLYMDADYFDEEEELEIESALHGGEEKDIDVEQRKLLIQRNV